MKKFQLIVALIFSFLMAGNAFATAPTCSPNPGNCGLTLEDLSHMVSDTCKCQELILKALHKDAKQDAQGQKKLDHEWEKLLKDLGLDSNCIPNPWVYEGSPKDECQDAKLLAKLLKQLEKRGCIPPPISQCH